MDTSTVSLGSPTRKSDYDRLLNNIIYIASSTADFYGPKTFHSATYFSGSIDIAGSVTIVGASRVRAYQNSAQSIPNATTTKVNLQAEEYDNLGEFTGSRFTTTQAGYYLINGMCTIDNIGDTGYLYALIYINGSAVATNYNTRSGAAADCSTLVTVIKYLDVGDYVELYTRENSGVRNMIAQADKTYLEIHRLS